MEFDVVVEVPRGSRNKYEMDHDRGFIRLDRQLFTATRYPADYGFIPDTLAEDGDPLDALVMLDEPTFPGCHVLCRPVGVLRMKDEHGPDSKILSVPTSDPRAEWRELDDVPDHLLREIWHFFEIYKDLEPNKPVEVIGWEPRTAAEQIVDDARQRCSRPRSGS
jgi:inorganic pyrophosphatase